VSQFRSVCVCVCVHTFVCRMMILTALEVCTRLMVESTRLMTVGLSTCVSLQFVFINLVKKLTYVLLREKSTKPVILLLQIYYTLPFKSLGSLRNVFILQRKALFFQ